MEEKDIEHDFEEMELEATAPQRLRQQFPDEVFYQTVAKEVPGLRQSHDKVIQKYRSKYNTLTSFKEKDTYFKNTLAHLEAAYKKVSKELTQKPKPYEDWVTAEVYRRMKSNGFRTTVIFYMSTGLIYENK
jgi:hypothetical protein